jgi:hypothetical protein
MDLFAEFGCQNAWRSLEPEKEPTAEPAPSAHRKSSRAPAHAWPARQAMTLKPRASGPPSPAARGKAAIDGDCRRARRRAHSPATGPPNGMFFAPGMRPETLVADRTSSITAAYAMRCGRSSARVHVVMTGLPFPRILEERTPRSSSGVSPVSQASSRASAPEFSPARRSNPCPVAGSHFTSPTSVACAAFDEKFRRCCRAER